MNSTERRAACLQILEKHGKKNSSLIEEILEKLSKIQTLRRWMIILGLLAVIAGSGFIYVLTQVEETWRASGLAFTALLAIVCAIGFVYCWWQNGEVEERIGDICTGDTYLQTLLGHLSEEDTLTAEVIENIWPTEQETGD